MGSGAAASLWFQFAWVGEAAIWMEKFDGKIVLFQHPLR
jgi:hypothetical protein